jgi:hypothetical protein
MPCEKSIHVVCGVRADARPRSPVSLEACGERRGLTHKYVTLVAHPKAPAAQRLESSSESLEV